MTRLAQRMLEDCTAGTDDAGRALRAQAAEAARGTARRWGRRAACSATSSAAAPRRWLLERRAPRRGRVRRGPHGAAVRERTGYDVSAGAHNKLLAKHASGMNKPAGQMVVPQSSVPGFLDTLDLEKLADWAKLGRRLGRSTASAASAS